MGKFKQMFMVAHPGAHPWPPQGPRITKMTNSHEYLFLHYALIDDGEVNLSRYFHAVWGNDHIDKKSLGAHSWAT